MTKVPLEERLTFTVEEAAQLLGIGRTHAFEMARRGELPTIRLGRRILIPKSRLMQMLEGQPNVTDTAT